MLVTEAVKRETDRLVEVVVATTEPFDDPFEALQAAVLAALQLTRADPLLNRLVNTEPAALLPLLVGARSVVASSVRTAIEEILDRRLPELPLPERLRTADLLTRLLISYSVSSPDDEPEAIAAFLATVLRNGVLHFADT